MLFGTYTFALFLALVLLGARLCPRTESGWRMRKGWLLTASYGFYACWNWPFAGLLALSTVVDFVVARTMYHRKRRRPWLMVSLAVNLGVLVAFKYADFLLSSVGALLSSVGLGAADAVGGPLIDGSALDIVLPVGISFYTFQTLSYTIDVYRGHMKPAKDWLDFALFVSFFPQLVAGPIVRADQFLPQCAPGDESARRGGPSVTSEMMATGVFLVSWGLFKKVAIADNLAPIADKIFAQPDAVGPLEGLTGLLAFSGQIYCDFSGYAHIAVGVALWLGFHLPDNFQHPYAAVGFSDFWRRWHITLSQWLRDYLYISLGGNRRGRWRTQRNLVITMLLGGLWHGAAWHFVAWGGLHGLYLVVERLVRRGRQAKRSDGFKGFAGALLTFALVLVTWAFFRANTTMEAVHLLGSIVGLGPGVSSAGVSVGILELALVGGVTAALVLGGWWWREHQVEHVAARLPGWMLVPGLVGLWVVTFLGAGGTRAFIYFQF
ncbi:MAG: MBOAT family O-acyltransferase [Bradymonadia bacterium]